MTESTDPDLLAYVQATSRLLALALDDAQARRVTVHLARTRGLAATLTAFEMAPDDDIAEIYRVAPFPAEDPR